MGWRGTLVLALLTVIVGAYLWFEGAPPDGAARSSTLLGEPRNVEPNKQVRKLLEFTPADVVSIRLEHGGQVHDAERASGEWRDTTAGDVLNDFLRNLTQIGVLLDIPANAGELKDYGLQPPLSVLRLQLRGAAEPLVLLIGDRNPAVTGAYVRVGENGPIELAGALVTWEFEKAFRALGDVTEGS